jgi:hypothetical protein
MPICCAGREDGSYHVINDKEMEEKGKGMECDAKEFSKLVLDCCSMLDDDGHNAGEVDVVACGPLLRLLGQEQLNASADANKEEEGREEGGRRRRVIGNRSSQAADDGNVEVRTMLLNTISSADQKVGQLEELQPFLGYDVVPNNVE